MSLVERVFRTRVMWLPLLLLAVLAPLTPQILLAQAELDLLIYGSGPYNNLKAGQDNIIYVEIRNIGKEEITNVRLLSEGPEGWIIELRPAEIEHISAGSVRTVEVKVKPASSTAEGEYRVALIAETNGASEYTSIWVTVEVTTSVWWWVGAGLAVIAIISFYLIFRRLGRY